MEANSTFDLKGFLNDPKVQADKAGAIQYLQTKGIIDVQGNVISQAQPNNQQELSNSGWASGLFSDALKTLIVKPAVRLGQAVGALGAKAVGVPQERIDQALATPVQVPITSSQGITIEPQKPFEQGGASQIASDALKSATYLAPYGKVAGAAAKGAEVLGASEAVGRVIGGATAGATGGYAGDVSQNLKDNGKVTGASFVPGFATLLGGLTGGAIEGGGVLAEKLTAGAKAYGKELEQQVLKLTPAQKTALGGKLDELTKFSLDNIPAGTPEERFTYAQDLKDHYESNLQFFLDTVSKENRGSTSISKDTFVRQLNAIKGTYKYDRDAEAVYKQIDDAVTTIKGQYPGDTIPVNKLNIFKRSTYQNAYNKAGSKVIDTVEHDIGDAARVAIERATKGGTIGDLSVGDFNAEYGNLIQLTKLLKLAANRPELGFTKRITSRVVGGLIGQAVGGGIPGIIGGELLGEPIASKVAGTATKTAVARKLQNIEPKQIGSIIQKIPTVRDPSAFGRSK